MRYRTSYAGNVWARYALIYLSLVASTAATLAAVAPWSSSSPAAAQVREAAPGESTAILSPLDTFLNLDSTNYSTSPELATYTWPDGKAANAIVMKFDLSSLPAGAVIRQATLSLSLLKSDGVQDTYGVSAHKVTGKAPNIAQVTGMNADAATPWTSSACCYNNTPLAQGDISAPYDTQMIDRTPGVKVWTITDMVQEWLITPASNKGLVLNSDVTKPKDRFRVFASMESADASMRPSLRVIYTAPDATPPTASIVAPAPGATVTGSSTLKVTALDNVGVAGVQFLLDGVAIGAEATNSPYELTWDSRLVSDGQHVLSAIARDGSGNKGAAAPIAVTVANGVIVLQPQDTYLNLDAINHSTDPTIGLYTWPDSKPANAIVMKFDLSALPAGATVQQATLNLALVSSDSVADTYSVRAQKIVGVDPIVAKATGMTADGTTAWTSNGCCSNNVPLAQANLTTPYDVQAVNTATGWKSWSLTAMAQEWLTDPASNFGVVLNADALKPRDRYRIFASMENADATLRPYLRVTYSANGDGVPPAVAITAPASGATVSGTTTVSATASDNVGVAGVQFAIDGVSIGAEDTAAPFEASWNSASASSGAHQLTAVARDAAGNTATSTVSVTVSRDTTRPTVSITAPSPRTTVSGTTTLRANASDNIGVVGVQFTIDGVNAGDEDTTSPYSISWDSAQVANGTHSLTAVARDLAGNTRTATAINITTSNDRTAPTVTVTAPAANATVSGTVTIRATASDNVGVRGVQFQVDGVNAGAEDTSSPYSISWNTASVAAGPHVLTAIARDAAGNTKTSAPVNFTTGTPPPSDTTPPTISNVATTGLTTAAATVTWTTNEASDSQVDYGTTTAYGSSSLVAPAMVTSHTVALSGLSAGTTYHARVRSKDAAGNAAVSGDVTFTTTSAPGGGGGGTPGTGLSALFPGDVNIESHPDVVFIERFDESSLTTLFNRWTDILNGTAMTFGTDAPTGVSRSLTIPWQGGGANNGGHLFKQLPTAITDTLYIRYYIKYPTSGLYQHSGIWMGGHNPSITWPDPQAGIRPAGNDRFSAAAEQDAATGRFDHYDYWTGMRLSGDGNYWGNKLLNNPAVSVTPGQWMCVEQMVKLNNPVSSANGQHTLWLNGTKVSDVGQGFPNGTWSGGNFTQGTGAPFEGFQWRTDPNLNINWIWLQLYAPNDPAGFQGTMKFAQVVAAKSRVGCMAPVSGGGGGLDTIAPTVSITSPAPGTNVSGTVTINATATDNVAVAGVQFQVDGANVGAEDTSSPYSMTWDSASASAGAHTITAVARDAAGNVTTSAAVSVTKPAASDSTPPAVALSAPAAGASVSATVAVSATASDNVGVAGVQFKADGANLGAEDTTSPYSVNWDTTTMSAGTHVLTAVARDSAGNTATSASRSVTVANSGGGTGGGTGRVLFDSTWDSASGTSSGAVTDGGRWPNYWEFNGGSNTQLLSVVTGGPGGHNALRVQQRGSSFAANVQVDNIVPQSSDYYLRFYMRNDDTSGSGDHIVTVDTWQYANLTFLRKTSSGSGWNFVASMYGCGYTYPIGHWGPSATLERGAWYRFEYFVHFVDPTHIQLHPRVYDANGTLLYSDADFRQSDFGGASWNGRSDWTFASYYAAGNSFCVDPSFVNDIGFGNNGQYGAADTGQYWYFSGVQVRTDTWPGAMPAIGGVPAPEAAVQSDGLALSIDLGDDAGPLGGAAPIAMAMIPAAPVLRRRRGRIVRRG